MFWDEVLGLGIKNRETQAARYEVPALRALREANVSSSDRAGKHHKGPNTRIPNTRIPAKPVAANSNTAT